MRVQKAPSGVMRIRHRTAISQTALPEVQKATDGRKIQLASLQAQGGEMDVPVIPRKSRMDEPCNDRQSLRQSKELEELLQKLNGTPSETLQDGAEELADEDLYVEDDLHEESLQSMDSVDVNLSGGSLETDLYASDGDVLRDESNTIPVGSGSYARVPSGGFHPVFESIKAACGRVVDRIRAWCGKSEAANGDVEVQDSITEDGQANSKWVRVAFIAAVLLAIVGIVAVVATSDKQPQQPDVAAQTPVAGNEDFAIVPIDEPEEDLSMVFDGDDDFAIRAFEDDEADVEASAALAKNTDKKKAEPAAAPAKNAAPVAAAPANTDTVAKGKDAKGKDAKTAAPENRFSELRLYGRNDNVMASVSKGEGKKLKRSCVLREGPASRFPLVKEIPAGTTIQVLTAVEDNWVLQNGGVWTKKGQPDKLGPGTQFADAVKGMSLPQPKSRVVSASNWKYVQAGKVYGYVGPACFK